MHNGWWLLSTQTQKPHLQCADGWWYGHESPFLQFGQNLHLSGRPPPLPPSPTSAMRTETNKLLVRNFLRQMCTRMDGVLIKKKIRKLPTYPRPTPLRRPGCPGPRMCPRVDTGLSHCPESLQTLCWRDLGEILTSHPFVHLRWFFLNFNRWFID